MAAPLASMRNIGIIAHIDAGKTTTSERILFYTGKEHRMGAVDEGTATMDWMEEERERGITITAAATTCSWRKTRINLIDTPGHVDFTAEVERSLRVLDGAVGVFCGVAGVEAQSHSVWKRADRYKVPRLAYVNKLDRVGADFERVVADIESDLDARTVVVTFPLGAERDLRGVASTVTGKGYAFAEEDRGRTVSEIPLTDDERAQLELWRQQLLDRVTEVDDTLTERLLAGGPPSEEELTRAIRRATIANHITPVFAGSSLKNLGVQPLLDGVVDFLPSPADLGSIRATIVEGKKAGTEVVRTFEPSEPLCALAFKTFATSHGELTYLRIYSGTLKTGDQVYNPRQQKKERMGQLLLMHAADREKIDQCGPGEIVATLGLKFTVTGDTLCTAHQPIALEPMVFPETVISMAIEPRSTADREKLADALARLAREDPTFEVHAEEETGQTIIAGIGELHLEVLANRLKRELGVDARVGKPRVSYRQTLAGAAEASGRFEREVGQKRLFGAVRLRVEPWTPPAGTKQRVEWKSELPTGTLPRPLEKAAEEAGLSAAASGGDLGYPIINVRMVLVDAEYHETDSVDVAYAAAVSHAFTEACERAGLTLLEPVMQVEVTVPDEYYGAVLNDLQLRRSNVTGIEMVGGSRVVRGLVPLAEMFGYSTQMRSLTQGRGAFTMEPFDYAPAPASAKPRWA